MESIRTGAEYIESLRGRDLDVYLLGERVTEPVVTSTGALDPAALYGAASLVVDDVGQQCDAVDDSGMSASSGCGCHAADSTRTRLGALFLVFGGLLAFRARRVAP